MSKVENAQLPSDQYYIRSGESFAGRNLVEDRSLLPKRVFCPTDRDNAELWYIQQLPNGRYTLRARGAPTGVINGFLYAFLIQEERAEEWVITPQGDDENRNLYTIEKADKSAGWVKQTDVDNPQIAVRPLNILPVGPPRFIPSELWNIQPLVD